MASNYNRRLLPAEVMVENGVARVIRRRQTLEDVLALESMNAPGLLIAFEGSRPERQADAGRAAEGRGGDSAGGRACCSTFPSYETHIGKEIDEGLHGGRDYGPDVMQLLYVANRYEKKPQIEAMLAAGTVVVCDRYLASSIAYGEAHGLDAGVAARDPALPAAAGSDHPARHRARDRGRAQDRQSRQVRARPRAAVARARELPPPGGMRAAGCGSTASARRTPSPPT